MLDQDQSGSDPQTQVIILSAHDSLSNAIESIKRGASSVYHRKLYAPEELLSLMEKALEKQRRFFAKPPKACVRKRSN